MNLKRFWLTLRSGEFIAVLEHLLKIKWFDFVYEHGNINEIIDKYSFEEKKLQALILYLQSNGLIKYKKNTLFLTDFSKRYLTLNSQEYLGDYVFWKIVAFQNWRKNIGNVLIGKSSTVHANVQYTDFTKKNLVDLEGITKGCAIIYPINDFVNIISKHIKHGNLLDIACGTGLWGFKIAEKTNSKLACLDIETETTKKFLNFYPRLKKKTQIIKQDMFSEKEKFPECKNVILANTCMDWEDEVVRKLLTKIKNETKCKTLFIHEFLLTKNKIDAGYNLLAELETRGRLRTKKWWQTELTRLFNHVEFCKLKFGSCAVIAKD